MNNNQKQVAPLETINASTLMNTQFDPLHFFIEKLLPQGIFILADSGLNRQVQKSVVISTKITTLLNIYSVVWGGQ